MARVSPIQTNFNAGRLSRRLEGRVDLAKYPNGCRVLQNFIPQIQGSAEKRPGTRYVADANQGFPAANAYSHVRLIPFEFSTDDAYILEFTHEAIRFYRNSGQIVVSAFNFADTDINVARDLIIPDAAIRHYRAHNTGPYHITTDGVLPTGLPAATDLFIVHNQENTFSFVAADVNAAGGGGIIDIGGSLGWGLNQVDLLANTLRFDAASGFANGHELRSGDGPFRLTTNGTLPTPLALATDYWVKVIDANLLQLSLRETLGEIEDLTAVGTSNSFITLSHDYADGEGPFRFTESTGGTLPAGLLENTDYYPFSSGIVAANRLFSFEVSLTRGGAAVDITDSGTDPAHTFAPFALDEFSFGLALTRDGVKIDITADGTGTHTLTPQGSVPFEVETPYMGMEHPGDPALSEIFELQFTQSADVMYITHPAHAPMKLSRTNHTEWILEEVAFDWVPFIAENGDDDLNVVSTGETGSVSLCSPDGIFLAGHVGGFFKQRVQVGGHYAKWVSGGTSTTTTNIYQNFENETLSDGSRAEHEGNVYEIVDTNGNTGTGTAAPIHKIGMQFDGRLHWEFLHSGAGYLRIDTLVNANRVLATIIKRIPRAAVSGLLITGITQASPAVVTTLANDVETGDEVFIFGVVGMTEVNERSFIVTRVTGTTFQLDGEDSTGHGAYSSGGNVPITRSGTGTQANTNNTKKQTDLWSLGAWSLEHGFPRTVTFFEDRLWFAGSRRNPQTLWASRTGDFEDHEITDEDESALIFTLSTDQVNVIEWISPGKVLAIGTAGGEFIASGASPEESITPDNIRIVRHSNYGSRAAIMPLRIEQVVLFIPRSGGRVREFVFDFDTDSFVAPDLTVLADDLFLQSVPTTPTAAASDKAGAPRTMAFQQDPNRTVWVALDSGDLLSMTYDRAQQVVGWHTHVVGNITGWSVQSVAVIPHPDGDGDQVWFAVRTGAATNSVIQVVFLEKPWHVGRALEDAFYLDSGLTYDPDPAATATTFTGLDHLEGLTVQVIADGLRRDDEVVSSGAITIDAPAVNVAQIGLGYDSILQTMRFEGGSQEGTAQGKLKRITKFVVRLFQTGLGLRYGAEDDALLEDVPQVAAVTAADLKDGDTDALGWPKGYEQAGRVLLKHSTPFPCTVVAIMPQISVQDR